ncbi:MAG: hypothetical protein GEU26_11550 [Nitrososphaeraceae archaeon]|nr:hypothetical protein [Nitrososphaeraceae archaeon]
MNSQDIILLLYLINKLEKVEGRKRLQKLIYILRNVDNIPFTFSFRPYYYGPYSDELSEAVDSLRSVDAISEELIERSSRIYQYNYIICDKGRNILQNQLQGIQTIIDKLNIVIERLRDIDTSELVTISKKIQSKDSE